MKLARGRRDEDDDGGDLLGRADPPQRDAPDRPLARLLPGEPLVARVRPHQGLPPPGVHRAGVDRVHQDPLPPVLLGQRRGEREVCRVGRARRQLPVGGLHPVVADHVHDAAAPAPAQVGDRGPAAPDVPHELQPQAQLPLLLGQVLEEAPGGRARAVDEDVQASVVGGRRVHAPPGVLPAHHVPRHHERLVAGRPRDRVRGRAQALSAAGAERDPRALARELHPAGEANALGAARDEDGLPAKSQVHLDRLLPAPRSRDPGHPRGFGETPPVWFGTRAPSPSACAGPAGPPGDPTHDRATPRYRTSTSARPTSAAAVA